MTTISLGICTDAPNVVNKAFEPSKTLTGTFRSEIDIVDPVIRITGSDATTMTYNYVYITELNRYYYVTSISIVATGVYDLQLHVDVLMTYADYLTSEHIIYAVTDKHEITRYDFSDGDILTDTAGYILVALSGVD